MSMSCSESKILDHIDEGWIHILPDLDPVLRAVSAATPDDANLCPPKNQWFRWARLTALDDVRVVIIGQDPYYTKGTANGLAFACTEKKVPPSLRNIYECLWRQKLILRVPNHGRLDEWAQRGVLLLNAALSTEFGHANAHSAIWRPYVETIVRNLCEYGKKYNIRYTFLLWGVFAQGFKTVVDTDAHSVLEWNHPSPMAQSRAVEKKKFVHCDHFKICTQRYGIDWNISAYDAMCDAELPLKNKAENK